MDEEKEKSSLRGGKTMFPWEIKEKNLLTRRREGEASEEKRRN